MCPFWPWLHIIQLAIFWLDLLSPRRCYSDNDKYDTTPPSIHPSIHPLTLRTKKRLILRKTTVAYGIAKLIKQAAAAHRHSDISLDRTPSSVVSINKQLCNTDNFIVRINTRSCGGRLRGRRKTSWAWECMRELTTRLHWQGQRETWRRMRSLLLATSNRWRSWRRRSFSWGV